MYTAAGGEYRENYYGSERKKKQRAVCTTSVDAQSRRCGSAGKPSASSRRENLASSAPKRAPIRHTMSQPAEIHFIVGRKIKPPYADGGEKLLSAFRRLRM